MKPFKIFSFALLVLLFSSRCFAFDAEAALNSYNSFKAQISQISTPKIHARSIAPKTIQNVLLQGFVVDGDSGLSLVTTEHVPTYVDRNAVRSVVSSVVYETNTYGLYVYQGIQTEVWYSGGYASVVAMIAPRNL
jgi:hypothetical protein